VTPLEVIAQRPSLGRRRILTGKLVAEPFTCAQCHEAITDGHMVLVMGEAALCFDCVQLAVNESYIDVREHP
jgi:hypothetical protein